MVARSLPCDAGKSDSITRHRTLISKFRLLLIRTTSLDGLVLRISRSFRHCSGSISGMRRLLVDLSCSFRGYSNLSSIASML